MPAARRSRRLAVVVASCVTVPGPVARNVVVIELELADTRLVEVLRWSTADVCTCCAAVEVDATGPVGAAGAAATVIMVVVVVSPVKSRIETVKVPALAPVGVPLITPVAGAIDNPAGSDVIIENVGDPLVDTVGATLQTVVPAIPASSDA